MTQPDPFDLDSAFAKARAAPPQMSDAVRTRIAADALAYQPRRPLVQRIWRAIGGPAGLGGLVTATVAGAWFGLAPPSPNVDPLIWVADADLTVDQDLTDIFGAGWYSDEG